MARQVCVILTPWWLTFDAFTLRIMSLANSYCAMSFTCSGSVMLADRAAAKRRNTCFVQVLMRIPLFDRNPANSSRPVCYSCCVRLFSQRSPFARNELQIVCCLVVLAFELPVLLLRAQCPSTSLDLGPSWTSMDIRIAGIQAICNTRHFRLPYKAFTSESGHKFA